MILHYTPSKAKHSIIDLVLVSENIATHCQSRTGLDTANSDHFPIFTTIDDNFSFKNIFLYKLNINKKDLALLYHTLHLQFPEVKDNLSEDTPIAYLQQHIKNHLYSFFLPEQPLKAAPFARCLLPSPSLVE